MEKFFEARSGYLILMLLLVALLVSVLGLVLTALPWYALGFVVVIFLAPGFIVVNPNEAAVLILFGKYMGSLRANGFFWANPFFVKRKISLKARNFDSSPIKVNDKVGNPIMIGLVLVWRVEDTFKASFDVDAYETFVMVQSDAALRKMAGLYPYDNFENDSNEITLRASSEEVNAKLENEIRERLSIAGIEVIEARINHIAYASEIAGAMLRRQQAIAVVAAREKIVEGAVSMVQLALNQLAERNIIELDDDKKAAMVSNLMVVLCSDESAQPVINAGTLHQ